MLRTAARRGLSLAEVMIATLVLACLGVAVQSLMVSTLKGVGVDRVSEVKRNITLDLLERFAHPRSSISTLFPADAPVPATRVLTVDEALGDAGPDRRGMIGLSAEEATVAKAILAAGQVTGFQLVWHRGVAASLPGSGRSLRLDRLWCYPVDGAPRGARVNSFRVFHVRGGAE